MSVAMFIPEVGVLASVPRTPLYLSLGVGHTLLARGAWPQKFELYVGLGADIGDRDAWALRPKVRLHNVDPWAGTIAELGVGVRRRPGRS